MLATENMDIINMTKKDETFQYYEIDKAEQKRK